MALKVVALASGRGSNLRALFHAQDREGYRVVAVGTDKPGCGALQFAASEDRTTTFSVAMKDFSKREEWNEALAEQVQAFTPDLLVLAGFMKVIGAPLLSQLEGRIVNVHPSLLPAFPGVDAPRQALEAGVRIAGCTVHRVDAGVDSGTVLAQAAVPVLPSDDVNTLHQRIQKQEHRLLPSVIGRLARGELALSWNRTTGNENLIVPAIEGDAH